MRAVRGMTLLMVLVLAGGGCRTPVAILSPGTPPPALVKPNELTAVTPTRIEPDYATLPAANADPEIFSHTYRGLDLKAAGQLAAVNASLANLLDRENENDSVLGFVTRKGVIHPGGDDLLREARRLTAVTERNRAALEALERFLQLADAQGRNELYTAGIANFNRVSAEAQRLRAASLPVPSNDELLRQRATLVAGREAIDAGIALLNHDLSSKLGVSLASGERFWPVGPFGMSGDAIDGDAAVKAALATRADLQLLRMLRDRLSADTLPSVRESWQVMNGLAGASRPVAAQSAFQKWLCRCAGTAANPLDEKEVEARKRQVAELLTARETEVTAQVRNAIAQMAATSRRVAALRVKAENVGAELEKSKAANKLADVLTLETEHLKARSEVLAAVFEWHAWRVRLKAAQGLLGAESFETPPPPSPPPPPARIPVKVQSTRFARPAR